MTHVIMKKNLAKALMDAGVEHFDSGGMIGGGMGQSYNPLSFISGALTTQNGYQAQNPYDPSILQNAVNQNQQVYGQQQTLANQLMQQANGGGPNPAQQLQQNAMNQNAAQANAIAQSQRGTNPGLAARDATMAATGANQTAAGVNAAQAQQQQLNAQGQLSGLYNNMAGTAQGQQGLYDQANANTQGINAQVSQNNVNAVNKTQGGILNGIGGALGLYKGGEVPSHLAALGKIYHPQRFADGGTITVPGVPNLSNANSLGSSQAWSPNFQKSAVPSTSGMNYQLPEMGSQFSGTAPSLGVGSLDGSAAASAGPGLGLGSLGSAGAMAFARGGAINGTPGGKIPGKDVVPGKNSIKNDVVPILASPKEVMLPLSVTQAKDAPSKAAEFMRHLKKQKGESDGYEKVVAARKAKKGK